jgi:hypothetical protein
MKSLYNGIHTYPCVCACMCVCMYAIECELENEVRREGV